MLRDLHEYYARLIRRELAPGAVQRIPHRSRIDIVRLDLAFRIRTNDPV
jgi:hypothetical protein